MDLKVHEIFLSIEGETVHSGFPALFIRLSGCNLDCRWCDTPEAKGEGTGMTAESVLQRIGHYRPHHVTVTGGEPLCQEGSAGLLELLIAGGYDVQVETNGSVDVSTVPQGVRTILDVKTPSSGEEGSFLFGNLKLLKKGDEIKFVVADDGDYRFAKDFMSRHLAGTPAVINLSPAYGAMNPEVLAGMMLRDGLGTRLNLQLHKIIWGEREGKVTIPLDGK